MRIAHNRVSLELYLPVFFILCLIYPLFNNISDNSRLVCIERFNQPFGFFLCEILPGRSLTGGRLFPIIFICWLLPFFILLIRFFCVPFLFIIAPFILLIIFFILFRFSLSTNFCKTSVILFPVNPVDPDPKIFLNLLLTSEISPSRLSIATPASIALIISSVTFIVTL